jgi:hypothetical protein
MSPAFSRLCAGLSRHRKLRSYPKAKIVFDATVFFCARVVKKRDRTVHNVQAAAPSRRAEPSAERDPLRYFERASGG